MVDESTTPLRKTIDLRNKLYFLHFKILYGTEQGMSFIVNFHYEGNFARDYEIYYLGGHEYIVDNDPDKWSFFKATSIVKDLSPLGHSKY